ncbi:MAG: polysaccharide deacetylase family protein [Muribaculaceae bacterium]|nr:polysaccharide deacetylase family protein [Muribaculaceae bacterium]MDE6027051.1 polysaccharide deacetylase family protein [Muribaculaceae bacterium]
MLIEQPPKIFRVLNPGGIFRIPPGGDRSVYLTFDDGPIPEATPWVLDQLDRYGIKATFFMVGDNVRKYPHIYEEVKRRGHRIGNHTMHHIQGAHTSTRAYLRDVAEADRLIGSDLFRPPHGWLRPRQARILSGRYRIIMYDLVTRDYSKRIDAERVVENVKRYVRPGSIIVFHDSLKSREKLETALPEAIAWLLREGYSFKLL